MKFTKLELDLLWKTIELQRQSHKDLEDIITYARPTGKSRLLEQALMQYNLKRENINEN